MCELSVLTQCPHSGPRSAHDTHFSQCILHGPHWPLHLTSLSFSLSFLQAYILPHVPCHTFVLFLLTVSFAEIAFALSFEGPHVPILLHLAETSLQMAPSRGLCVRIAPFPPLSVLSFSYGTKSLCPYLSLLQCINRLHLEKLTF